METIFTILLSPRDYVQRVPLGGIPVALAHYAPAPLKRIPAEVDVRAWPAAPHLPCWRCGIGLEHDVWFIPRAITCPVVAQFRFVPIGCFCTLVCLYEFMRQNPKFNVYESNVRLMIIAKVGRPPTRFIVPPDMHFELSKFGVGTMTEAKYTAELKRLENEMFFMSPGTIFPHS
jgi:hypothetical protein